MRRAEFSHTVELPADRETAFWDLLNPDHVVEYDPDFRSWTPRVWPPELGTRVDFVARYGRIWAKGTSEFTVVQPPRTIELKLVSPPSPVRSGLSWEFESTDEGCRLTYRFATEAPTGFGWLGRRLLAIATDGMAEKLDRLPERYG